MKYRIALAITLFTLSAGSYANSLCQEKEQDIQKISYAEKHNNQRRIEGLNKALSEVRANCTDSKLRAEHQKRSLSKEEVAERQRDLAEAKAKAMRIK